MEYIVKEQWGRTEKALLTKSEFFLMPIKSFMRHSNQTNQIKINHTEKGGKSLNWKLLIHHQL